MTVVLLLLVVVVVVVTGAKVEVRALKQAASASAQQSPRAVE